MGQGGFIAKNTTLNRMNCVCNKDLTFTKQVHVANNMVLLSCPTIKLLGEQGLLQKEEHRNANDFNTNDFQVLKEKKNDTDKQRI